MLALVAALRPLVEQIRLLTSEIAHALRIHTDGEISCVMDARLGRSQVGPSGVLLAQVAGKLGDLGAVVAAGGPEAAVAGS